MRNERLRLVLHGAIVLLVGLLCGLPTTVESLSGSERHWHVAHEGLIMMGVWMLVSSSILSGLLLGAKEAAALFWALLAMGYGFLVSLVIGGVIDADVFSPGGTVANNVAFVCSVLGIGGAIIAASLIIMGAWAALKASPKD